MEALNEKDFNAVFGHNLSELLSSHKMSQLELAQRLGVSAQSVSNWCKGKKTPRMPKVDMICDIFGLKREWLTSDHDSHADSKPSTAVTTKVTSIRIPVLGSVAAGIPISAITDIVDWEDIPEKYASDGTEYFGLKLKGNSMSPEMRSGDVVIVRAQSEADSGDIVIVQVNGDTEATCKRLIKYKDGITLMPLNSEYPPMQYTAEEVISSPVHIIGKVVEVRRKF